VSLPYGITSVPLAYMPAVKTATELAFVKDDKSRWGGAGHLLETEGGPARQLPNLQKMPILVLTSEASYHSPYDHCTVKISAAGRREANRHSFWRT